MWLTTILRRLESIRCTWIRMRLLWGSELARCLPLPRVSLLDAASGPWRRTKSSASPARLATNAPRWSSWKGSIVKRSSAPLDGRSWLKRRNTLVSVGGRSLRRGAKPLEGAGSGRARILIAASSWFKHIESIMEFMERIDGEEEQARRASEVILIRCLF